MESEIQRLLFENRDLKYREFHARLIPNIDRNTIIGVRTPVLRKIAKEYAKHKDKEEFLSSLPHGYYDENNLHGFIICECRDYDKTIEYLNEFLPFVDNWATCDLLRPKAFEKNKKALSGDIDKWLAGDKPYIIRFGIEMLMVHFLDEDFNEEYLEKVAKIKSEHYYVKMMIAWYFATALAKQWGSAVKYIENGTLGIWEHNKTISKANESYRITDEQKKYLKALKIKEIQEAL